MLIMSQNRKCLFNLEKAGTLFLSSYYGDYEEGKPVKVLASFPLAEDVTENLGEYESEARAMEVLEEIVQEYGMYFRTDGGINKSAFAFARPKVYKMPEK